MRKRLDSRLPDTSAYKEWLGIVGSLVGFVAFNWLLCHVSAPLVGTYAYVNPAIAVLLGVTHAATAQSASGTITGRVLWSGCIRAIPLPTQPNDEGAAPDAQAQSGQSGQPWIAETATHQRSKSSFGAPGLKVIPIRSRERRARYSGFFRRLSARK